MTPLFLKVWRVVKFSVAHLAPPAVMIGCVAPIAWWYMDSDPPLTVYGYHLQTPVVDRGGNLGVSYDVDFKRRCSGAGRRTFVDVTHFRMPIDPYLFRAGVARDGAPVTLHQRSWMPVEATVPDASAPGPATYQNVTQFYCNPLQIVFRNTWADRQFSLHITFRYPVINFTVSPNRAPKIMQPKTLFKPVYEYPPTLEDMPTTTPPPPPDDDDEKRAARQ